MKQFIKANIDFAINELERNEYDYVIVEAIKESILDVKLTHKWMASYGLFIKRDVKKCQELAKDVTAVLNKVDRSKENSSITFLKLLKKLHISSQKQAMRDKVWLSASSKLLWCAYPEEGVIYDLYTSRAITVIQGLESSLVSLPRLGPKTRFITKQGVPDFDQITAYYNRYSQLVHTLLQQYKTTIDQALKEKSKEGLNHLRVLDKLLFLLGKENSELKPWGKRKRALVD